MMAVEVVACKLSPTIQEEAKGSTKGRTQVSQTDKRGGEKTKKTSSLSQKTIME